MNMHLPVPNVSQDRVIMALSFIPTRSVTLEEDLIRRDLTINAMAMDNEGTLYDPYGGQRDLVQ